MIGPFRGIMAYDWAVLGYHGLSILGYLAFQGLLSVFGDCGGVALEAKTDVCQD